MSLKAMSGVLTNHSPASFSSTMLPPCHGLRVLSPVIGLAILADSLIGNHEVRPMIGYVKNNLNLKLTDEQCEQLECELETIARE
jgi:hypothetical protein